MITGTTKLLGVIGYPIAHSLSPVMHNSAIGHLGMDYVYLPLPVKPENLSQAIEGFRAIDLQGFNVTIPHKQAILPLLTEVSAIAHAVGAVNTVWWTGHHWAGTNTDVAGFVAPLKAGERDWSQATAVVLGNGGAARAVVVGCQHLGFANIQNYMPSSPVGSQATIPGKLNRPVSRCPSSTPGKPCPICCPKPICSSTRPRSGCIPTIAPRL